MATLAGCLAVALPDEVASEVFIALASNGAEAMALEAVAMALEAVAMASSLALEREAGSPDISLPKAPPSR